MEQKSKIFFSSNIFLQGLQMLFFVIGANILGFIVWTIASIFLVIIMMYFYPTSGSHDSGYAFLAIAALGGVLGCGISNFAGIILFLVMKELRVWVFVPTMALAGLIYLFFNYMH